jgi:hypothetical protein
VRARARRARPHNLNEVLKQHLLAFLRLQLFDTACTEDVDVTRVPARTCARACGPVHGDVTVDLAFHIDIDVHFDIDIDAR